MTVTIDLSPDEERRLQQRAEEAGQEPAVYLQCAIRRLLDFPATSGRSFAEILAPIHEDFRRSGMSEAELDALLEDAICSSRSEPHASDSD
jgi:predicted transcriptional regulator